MSDFHGVTFKRCPFCSGSAKIRKFRRKFDTANVTLTFYAVVCRECGASGSQITDQERAVEAWNHRSAYRDG